MRLIRFGEPGAEKPGVLLDDQTRLDVSSFVSDYDEEFFGSGGLARLRQWLMNGMQGGKHTCRSERHPRLLRSESRHCSSRMRAIRTAFQTIRGTHAPDKTGQFD